MDNSKERKSLIFFSTTILLFWWLDLPESIVFERILGEEIGNQLSAWKVWLAILIVLSYQSWRFKSTSETKDEWNEFQTDKSRTANEILKIYVKFLFSRGLDSTPFIEYKKKLL